MPSGFFRTLSTIAHVFESMQVAIGVCLRWLVVAMTFTIGAIVIARAADIGSTAVQESVTYMHGVMFMLCLAYTAHRGGHVRVDIFYQKFSAANKAWVNLLGAILFLLPFALFMLFISIDTALSSWATKEASTNPGGLAIVYILKSLTPAAGLLLAMQATSDICRGLIAVSISDNKPSSTHPNQKI